MIREKEPILEPKKESKLTPEDKEKLAELATERLKNKDFYGARIMFKQAGRSEEELKPLFEAEKFLKEKSPEKEQEDKAFSPEDKETKERLQEIANGLEEKYKKKKAKEEQEEIEPGLRDKKTLKKMYKEMLKKAKKEKDKGRIKFYKDGLKELKKYKKKK